MSRLKNFGLTAALAAIPLLTAATFASLTIYAGNVAEFSIAWSELLRTYLPYLLVVALVLGAPAGFLSTEGLRRYQSVLAVIAILTWLQGNILVWDYGALDGRSIEWTAGAWRGVADAGLWIVGLIVAVRAYERFGRVFTAAAVAVVAIQVIGAATTLASGPDEILTRESVAVAAQGSDDVFEFSSQANVLHIVMDGFQTDIFEDIVFGESGQATRNLLQGFTLFENNMGVYPYTQLTIPALLTGKLHRNEVPVDDFVQTALRGETILGAAIRAGYEVDVAAPVGLANTYSYADHTNVHGITAGSHVNRDDVVLFEAARLIDLSLFRVVPHFVKALVYRDELWVFQAHLRPERHRHMQFFSDVTFLERFAGRMSVGRDTPVYKMIHVMLAHKPTVGNADCEYVGKQATTRETVVSQATCGLDRVSVILSQMQDLGIYDNTLIVLMADHGAWVPVDGMRNLDSAVAEVHSLTVAMASPVLAVKPPGTSGVLQVSPALTSIVDVPATVADLAGLDGSFPGIPAFNITADATRDRFHAIYAYGPNPDAEEFLYPMQEYVVSGDSHDARSWQLGGRHLPGGITETPAESD